MTSHEYILRQNNALVPFVIELEYRGKIFYDATKIRSTDGFHINYSRHLIDSANLTFS